MTQRSASVKAWQPIRLVLILSLATLSCKSCCSPDDNYSCDMSGTPGDYGEPCGMVLLGEGLCVAGYDCIGGNCLRGCHHEGDACDINLLSTGVCVKENSLSHLGPSYRCSSGGGTDAKCSKSGSPCEPLPCCEGFECNQVKNVCVETTRPTFGEPCDSRYDPCEYSFCHGEGEFSKPYCSRSCTWEGDCNGLDRPVCCNAGVCEFVTGEGCGDGQGVLKDPCTEHGASDCYDGFTCVGDRNEDGTFQPGAICLQHCGNSSECLRPEIPDTKCHECQNGICQPRSGCNVPCRRDTDCDDAAGERCMPQWFAGYGQIWDCRIGCPATGVRVGEPCGDDTDCCSTYCRKGICAGPCETDADCGPDALCVVRPARPGDYHCPEPIMVSYCEAFAGSRVSCETSGECPSGESCQIAPSDITYRWSVCTATDVSQIPGGGPCSRDADCRSNLCGERGVCLDLCHTDADCPSEFGPMICATARTFWNYTAACLPAPGSKTLCARDADCSGAEVCTTFSWQESYSLCVTPIPSGGAIGTACASDADCAGAMCAVEGRCTGPCVTDADCAAKPGTAAFCLERQDMVFQPVRRCVTIDGSGAPCKKDADCPAGEVCKIMQANVDGLMIVCGLPTEGGQPPGDPCGSCPDGCENDCTPDPCANDHCVQGRCAAVCATNRDCIDPWMFCEKDPVRGVGACASSYDVLCRPCTIDVECGNPAENLCDQSLGGTHTCGVGCDPADAVPCPGGFKCREQLTATGVFRGYVCRGDNDCR